MNAVSIFVQDKNDRVYPINKSQSTSYTHKKVLGKINHKLKYVTFIMYVA